MAENVWQTGPNPVIELTSEGRRGEVVIKAGTAGEIRAEGNVTLTGQGEQLSVHTSGSATLHVPANTHLRLDDCQLNVRIEHITGATEVNMAHGDLTTTGCGPLRANEIGGDLRADNVVTSLEWRAVGGDCELTTVVGWARGGAVGGDLVIRDLRSWVDVAGVGGDAKLTDVGGVTMKTVGGDCVIEGAHGAVSVNSVGGDLHARSAQGLTVQNVGGDCHLDGEIGEMSVRGVGGDLRAEGAWIARPVALSVGGDVTVGLLLADGGQYTINAGGDIVCNLSPQASATVTAMSGEGVRTYHVGAGKATVTLRAGGDITLRGADGVQVKRDTRDRDSGFKMGAFTVNLPPIPPIPPIPPSRPMGFRNPPGSGIEHRIEHAVESAVSGAVASALDAIGRVTGRAQRANAVISATRAATSSTPATLPRPPHRRARRAQWSARGACE